MIETVQINYIQVVKSSLVLAMSDGGTINYQYQDAAAAWAAMADYNTSFGPTELVSVELIPDMTSHTTPSGTVTASQESAGPAWYVFDQDDASAWVSTLGGFPAPQWVQYQFSSGHVATRYSISSLGTTDYITGLTLEGSNDGALWTALDTQAGLTWIATPTTKTFTFSNSTSYSYYRWTVTAIAGTGTLIVSIQLYTA